MRRRQSEWRTCPEDNYRLIQDSAASSRVTFQSELFPQIQAETDQFCSTVGASVANIVVTLRTAYDDELLKVNAARRRRYWVVGAFTAIIVVFIYLLYFHYRRPAPDSTVGNILLGVTSGLIVEVVVLLITKWRENVPGMIKKIRERFEAKMKDEIRQATDVVLRSHQFESLNEAIISNRLSRMYEAILVNCSVEWKQDSTKTLQTLAALQANYLLLRAEYLDLAEDICRQCGGYFSDSARNLEILNTVANRIKEKAIEPSFDLLEETRNQLELVKTQVESVRFI